MRLDLDDLAALNLSSRALADGVLHGKKRRSTSKRETDEHKRTRKDKVNTRDKTSIPNTALDDPDLPGGADLFSILDYLAHVVG